MSRSQADESFSPAANWRVLRLRAGLLRRLRAFFAERGFLEVETPLLSEEIVTEQHLDPFSTILAADARRPTVGRTLYLQPSPEAAMKRLLAAGGAALYQVTRSFRNGETGPLHNPEFTIVEWYRRGDSMEAGIELLSDLCSVLLPRGPATRLSYREAFLRYAGIDPLAARTSELVDRARASSPAAPPLSDSDRDGWLQWLLVELVEPHLGADSPTILYAYPASQACLARIRADDPLVAERFELYVQGIELANGYHELTDAAELRRRCRTANQARGRAGKPPLPEARHLLAAMESGLPDCTGVALGFDRLIMLAASVRSIADAMAFPIDRA